MNWNIQNNTETSYPCKRDSWDLWGARFLIVVVLTFTFLTVTFLIVIFWHSLLHHS